MNQKGKKFCIRELIIGGALLCFAYIAYRVSTQEVLPFDTVIREWIYARRCPLLNSVFIPITYMGNWQTVTILGFILLYARQTRRTFGIPFALVSLSSTLIYKIAKSIFARPRPDLAVRIIEQGGFSFPSGHSMNGIVCFGILIYLIRKNCKDKKRADQITVLLVLLIFFIGFSRIYVGVHFPSDVVGGWCLGIVFLCLSIAALEKIEREKSDSR